MWIGPHMEVAYAMRSAHLQVDCQVVVKVGDPREIIPNYVIKHKVDLVVVGTRGRGKLKRWDLETELLRQINSLV